MNTVKEGHHYDQISGKPSPEKLRIQVYGFTVYLWISPLGIRQLNMSASACSTYFPARYPTESPYIFNAVVYILVSQLLFNSLLNLSIVYQRFHLPVPFFLNYSLIKKRKNRFSWPNPVPNPVCPTPRDFGHPAVHRFIQDSCPILCTAQTWCVILSRALTP